MANAEPFPILDRLRRGRFIITAEQANPAQMKRYNSLTRRGVAQGSSGKGDALPRGVGVSTAM